MSQPYWIDRVRIRNRHNCCPERLGGTKVFVDGKEGGQVTGRMSRGQWSEVKFSKPLYGRTIRLVTTQNTYLSISGFEAYTGAAQGGSVTKETVSSSKCEKYWISNSQ